MRAKIIILIIILFCFSIFSVGAKCVRFCMMFSRVITLK